MRTPLINPASPPDERTAMETAHFAFVQWLQTPDAVDAAAQITPARYEHLRDFDAESAYPPLDIPPWTTTERRLAYSVIGFYPSE